MPPPISRAAIDQGVQDLVAALNARDAAKASAQHAEDSVFVNARGRFDTRAGIEAFWAGALKAPNAGKDLKVEVVKWGTSGDLAYTLSRFTGGVTASTGYVLTVHQRQADGSLKNLAQVSIPDPPKK
jgi:ketosteroid isomerase-like protein